MALDPELAAAVRKDGLLLTARVRRALEIIRREAAESSAEAEKLRGAYDKDDVAAMNARNALLNMSLILGRFKDEVGILLRDLGYAFSAFDKGSK